MGYNSLSNQKINELVLNLVFAGGSATPLAYNNLSNSDFAGNITDAQLVIDRINEMGGDVFERFQSYLPLAKNPPLSPREICVAALKALGCLLL
jgi:hypothetical protein